MSPFKSEAQRRKFAAMVKAGTMSQSTFDEWNRDTPEHLPERIGEKPVGPKAKALRERARKKRRS